MIRQIVSRYLPRSLLALYREAGQSRNAAAEARPPEWSLVPEGWEEGDARGYGWSHDSVVAGSVARWPLFLRTVQGTGPLGVDCEALEISDQNRISHALITAFSYVLARAAHQKDELTVLDFGGGLGNYSRIARVSLPELSIRYTVHDLPGFCIAGRDRSPEVVFESERERVFSRKYDVVFASSSVQYLRNWRKEIEMIAHCADPWLYVTRLAMVRVAPTFAVVQRPHAYGYHTEYLSWIFNRDEFIGHLGSCGLVPEREFLVEERPLIDGAPEQCEERGILFRRTGNARF